MIDKRSPYAESGPGSVATFGSRLIAYIVDAILAQLLAILVLGGYHVGGRLNLATYCAFLAIELVFVTLAGQTPGMRLAGIAVVPVTGGNRPAPQWVALRTVLLATVIPALISDSTGRCMHDRAANTVMLRIR